MPFIESTNPRIYNTGPIRNYRIHQQIFIVIHVYFKYVLLLSPNQSLLYSFYYKFAPKETGFRFLQTILSLIQSPRRFSELKISDCFLAVIYTIHHIRICLVNVFLKDATLMDDQVYKVIKHKTQPVQREKITKSKPSQRFQTNSTR